MADKWPSQMAKENTLMRFDWNLAIHLDGPFGLIVGEPICRNAYYIKLETGRSSWKDLMIESALQPSKGSLKPRKDYRV